MISHELYDKFINVDNLKYSKLGVVIAYICVNNHDDNIYTNKLSNFNSTKLNTNINSINKKRNNYGENSYHLDECEKISRKIIKKNIKHNPFKFIQQYKFRKDENKTSKEYEDNTNNSEIDDNHNLDHWLSNSKQLRFMVHNVHGKYIINFILIIATTKILH